MFMSVIGAVFGQTPATLPYSCDFEAAGDNGWTLKNGTCTNQWHVGSFISPAGHSGSLFISSDGGTTADYNIDAVSVVVAEKLFQTGTSDSLTISFDLTVEGETSDDGHYGYDYLKVFWVPADTVYEASFSTTYFAKAEYSTNVIMKNSVYASNYTLTHSDGEERMSVTIANEPNTLKKLVFVWVNDHSIGTQPGAIIDNISIIATPTPLPYSCDFEASGGNGWTLKNGTCTNKWHVGSFTSPAGHSGSLFISSDGGTTAGYDVNAESVVVAEKLFQTGTSDSLTIRFDLTVEGETINSLVYDYLKVFWVPADTVYEASTSLPYYADDEYSTNIIMSNAAYATDYTVNMLTGTQTMSATIANEANTLKKLVFLWRNDGGMGNQPGAIIDNLSVVESCDAPTALAVSNITETSADVSWNGTASSYQIRLNGGTPEAVTTTSKTFTGLTAGTAYTVEVRAVCASSQSAWTSIEFENPTPLPYTCDFEAVGDNGWTLKNGTCTNQWHVGSFTSPAGHSGSLFISSDGGTTADYDIYARSVVVAEKLFQTGTSDSLTISFDLTIGGENLSDYLKVYWVNADTVYDASTSGTYYADASYSTNVIMNNATDASYRFVNLLAGTQTMSATIANEPNTLKKLVFVWVNDHGIGTQPGAIIDNIYINDCVAPTALAVSNITETSAEVSWNGTATGYEVRLNGGTPETVSTTSKTFTGLTAGTAYTVEVRAVYASSQSAWTSIEFYTKQIPTPLPYTCDFEASGDNGWLLKNGTSTNQWHVGSFTSPAGHSGSLFISSDGGTTADYDIYARSVVVAEKLFQTGTSDSLTISFDLTIVGEEYYDYLKVFWVPADTVYEASTSLPYYYADTSYSTNVIMSNAISATNYTVSMLIGTQNMSATIANEPNTLKKLVFLWRNDDDGGNQPGAIIDNIYISDCIIPTDFIASNITQTSTDVSWSGTASSYQIRLNGGTPETVSTTSKTFTGLTAGTAYTVEVRAVCASSQSAWTSIEFYTKQIPTPLPYTCDFEAAGDNGWLLKNVTCTNQWHVGSFTSPAGHSGSLFISSDGGTTAGYDIDAVSVVVAEKLFQTGTSDSLTISFDLTIGGEENSYGVYDYLKVFWVPADTVYQGSISTPYFANAEYSPNVIMSNATSATNYTVNMLTGTQNMSATIANEPNTLKKLVFVWVNDFSDGEQPGAIIDNLSIVEAGNIPEPCDAPTALAVSNITQTSADVSWNGTATGYEVRLNGGTPETVTATSKTLTGLTAGTAYTVEVRAVCASSQSVWVSTSFTTTAVVVTPPTVNTLAASNITHDGATLNGTIMAGSEAITAQGFMYKASSATDWTTVAATGTNLSATVNNLTAETAYEYKAFATTASSTVEGEVINFTTLAASGLADAESGAIKAMIYPNPAKDKATLSLTGLTANAKIIVSDLQGRIIQTEDLQAGTETYELNTSNYASGVYYIRILCGNNVNTQKLIIE